MALAVCDVEMTGDAPVILPSGPAGAVVLLRVEGRPSGQAIVPLPLDLAAGPVRAQLMAAADSAFWEAWLRHRIGLPPEGPGPAELPTATVAICTRDRTDDLAVCLRGLAAMDARPPILVIDNAPSTEATRELVAQHPEVRYVREPRPGLNNARNAALAHADTEIVAFIDDDAAPDRRWFTTLIRNFADPRVLAATGLTMAMELESDAQIAFQRVGGFTRGFKRVVHHAGNCGPFKAWHAGAGVNMALRRSAVEIIGPFDPALDAGTRALAGGDTDYFRRILNAGYHIVYDPHALNWHRHRRSMAELEQQVFGYEAASFAVLTKALLFEHDARAIGAAARWLSQQLPRLLRRNRSGLPFDMARAQARGAIAGPGRYLQARRRARHG